MVMNLTNLTSSQGIYDIAMYANNSTTGILFNGFIIVLTLILFLAFMKTGIYKAAAASLWISFVIGALLISGGLVSLWLCIILLLLAGISTFLVYQE